MKNIVYLHGFLSAPESFKARQTRDWLALHRPDIGYHCPALSSYPKQALNQLHDVIESYEQKPCAIGSSLGGFWASYLLERELVEKATLINPAVSPHTRFGELVGVVQKSYYSDAEYCLQQSDLDFLATLEQEVSVDPKRYLILLQSGDEVLDYRMALSRYSAANIVVEQGGDHSFQGYEDHLPEILSFFDL